MENYIKSLDNLSLQKLEEEICFLLQSYLQLNEDRKKITNKTAQEGYAALLKITVKKIKAVTHQINTKITED